MERLIRSMCLLAESFANDKPSSMFVHDHSRISPNVIVDNCLFKCELPKSPCTNDK